MKERIKGFNNAESESVVIDIEFNCPESWMGKCLKDNSGGKTGKPDFIVYDCKTKSFGLIELKVNNDSTGNMIKHFRDFYNIIKSKKENRIKEEFKRKVQYLTEYKLLQPDTIKEKDLAEACNHKMWAAFLFIGGDAEKSKSIFQYNKEEFEKMNELKKNNMFGFRFYPYDGETIPEISLEKSNFNFNL